MNLTSTEERERVLEILRKAEKRATPPGGYSGSSYNPVVIALREVMGEIMAIPPSDRP